MVIMRNPYSGGLMTVGISEVERLVRLGWVTFDETPTPRQSSHTGNDVSEEGTPAVSDSETNLDTIEGAPKGNATRAAWRDYATSLGVNTEGMTRAEIREAVANVNGE